MNPNPNIPNPNPNLPPPPQNHACAACRFQRKKCSRDCPLAPYFPPDSQAEFLNAHKLFGVGNIVKVIKALHDPKEKDTAMETMMIQSDLRAQDPVLGCVGYIMNLERQIAAHQNELNLVLHRIASIRAANHQSALTMNTHNGGHGFAVNNQNYADVAHDYVNVNPPSQQQQGEEEGGGEGHEVIFDHQENGGGGENEDFGLDLNNENQWRLMNESGLIENGENGMSSMMMMLMMNEGVEGQDALVAPVLEERQFLDGFDRLNETNHIGCSR